MKVEHPSHCYMGTQEKVRVTLLSNEHLEQFIHSSLRNIVLSCNLKQTILILRPGYTVSLALVLPVYSPDSTPGSWSLSGAAGGIVIMMVTLVSIISAVVCVIGTDSLARKAPRSSDFKTAVDFCLRLSCTSTWMTQSRLRVCQWWASSFGIVLRHIIIWGFHYFWCQCAGPCQWTSQDKMTHATVCNNMQ